MSFVSAVAQTGGQVDPGKGQGQGQGGQGTGTGTGTGTGNGTQEDPIKTIRDNAKGRTAAQGLEYAFDRIGVISSRVNEYVTFRAIARNAKAERIDLVYTLKDAPVGALIDSQTGVFSWTPTLPGTYSFTVVGVDPKVPEKGAVAIVTIAVTRPLGFFGYDFFVAPRAAILGRLYAIQQGLAQPGLAFRTQGGSPMGQGLVPEGSALGTVLNPTNPGLNFPPKDPNTLPVTGGTANTPPGTQGPGTQTGGQTAGGQTGGAQAGAGTGTGGATPPGTTGATTMPPSGTIQGPVGTNVNPQNQVGQPLNLQDTYLTEQLDALRRGFVGPFDMINGNVFVPNPERYQLGPGDVMTLRVSSPTQEMREYPIKVDGRGAVNLPNSGRRVVVRGQTLAQAEQGLLKEIRRDVRDAQITLNLTELRAMSIQVIGEAFMPGSYQVPAVMTLFNALYIFGGPTDSGSLRKIELRRNDGTKRAFDLYRFLIYGDSRQDVPLQPGDTIFIPPVEARATVQGEVGRPAVFEVLPGEHLKDLLEFAGNPRPTGVSQRISHSTVQPGVGLKLNDVDLTKEGPANNPPVYAGDVIEVFSVRSELTNLISLEGAVDQPGQYALTEGMTVRALIQRARGLLPEAYKVAHLFRQNDDKTISQVVIDLDKALKGDPANDIALKAFDKLTVYKTGDVEWMGFRRVSVRGSIRKPGAYDRADGMRVTDLLLQAGGLLGNAFLEQGFLQRFNEDGTAGELLKIDFRKLAVGDPAHNLELRDRDVLTIQSVTEAQFVPEQEVKIVGRVQNPGAYLRSSNMTLRDLIQLAGGVMPDVGDVIEVAHARVPDGTQAMQYKTADVIAGIVNPLLDAGDLVTIPQRSDFNMDVKTVIVLGSVMRPGVYAINKTTDRISDVIKRAGGPSPTAFLRGAQFVREPALLKTLSQERLGPGIREVLKLINDDEYKRAMASAEIDRLRVAKSIQGTASGDAATGLAAIGLGQAPKAAPTEAQPLQFFQQPVTPARQLPTVLPGNINVKFDEALSKPGSANDLVLAEGDVILVPETPSTVLVTGAVTVQSAILFMPGKSVSYYIDHSGGFTVDVAKDRILLIRANGEIIRANARTKVELGDVILVPTKVMAARISDKQAEIDAISKNVTSAGIIFAVLKSLFGG